MQNNTNNVNDFSSGNLINAHQINGLKRSVSDAILNSDPYHLIAKRDKMKKTTDNSARDIDDNADSTKGALPNGKKTKGRVKIKMEFIDNKLRRYTTFSKRKTGIMKKAYELSTLTGTQVMLLVASETGHVYTFATRKLQPMITSEAGKALIQTCLNSPDPMQPGGSPLDQRMSATGYEETDLSYAVNEDEEQDELQHEKDAFISDICFNESSNLCGSMESDSNESSNERRSPASLLQGAGQNSKKIKDKSEIPSSLNGLIDSQNLPFSNQLPIELPNGLILTTTSTASNFASGRSPLDNCLFYSPVTASEQGVPRASHKEASNSILPFSLPHGVQLTTTGSGFSGWPIPRPANLTSSTTLPHRISSIPFNTQADVFPTDLSVHIKKEK